MNKYPVYRLIEGRIMYQSVCGGRWIEVDKKIFELMLELYNGLEPEFIKLQLAALLAEEKNPSQKEMVSASMTG